MARLRWVLLGLYVALVMALFAAGLVASGESSSMSPFFAVVALHALTQVFFILVAGPPDYLAPTHHRRLILPALIAGFMMLVLVVGMCVSALELLHLEPSRSAVPYFVAAWAAVWLGWAVVFFIHCRRLDGFTVVRRLIKWLLAGSLLQLLSTVPSHIVVTRRPGCLVGMWTAGGICAGLYVMIWAFGPGIFLLFRAETRKRLPGHCRSCGRDLTGYSVERCPSCGQALSPTPRPPSIHAASDASHGEDHL